MCVVIRPVVMAAGMELEVDDRMDGDIVEILGGVAYYWGGVPTRDDEGVEVDGAAGGPPREARQG